MVTAARDSVTVMASAPESTEFGPWNPGLKSELPAEHLPLSTMFRGENVSTSLKEAREVSDFCGLPPFVLVAFRPERLIVHELLIRVTANLSVPEGQTPDDLGVNFRQTADTILTRYIAPHLADIVVQFEKVQRDALAWVSSELARHLTPERPRRPKSEGRGWFARLWRGSAEAKQPVADPIERERDALAEWEHRSTASAETFEGACFEALAEVVSAIIRRRGRLLGDTDLITRLAATLVCNRYGSTVIGDAIEPFIRDAAAQEGYHLLPAQAQPVVMNVKGASASGKSTMRALQRSLAERLGIPWDDFAVISPDIWRKFLLDYDALGEAYKYAGTMSGHELEIIDRKLDSYMAAKAARGEMSHLLIDRFRFDSFVPETEDRESSKLLTRFGHLIYMFFMITPPEATVERAWKRGLRVGRYKAVDDLLDHNIEAYTGMPQLFFTWALRTRKRVHYEFLDNSVAEGERPRTVAFGWNGEMNILDLKALIDVDRFRKVNVDARTPAEVRDPQRMSPERNTEFLRQCAGRIPAINLADAHTGSIYARLEQGSCVWRDEARLAEAATDPDTGAAIEALRIQPAGGDGHSDTPPTALTPERSDTLGTWGMGAPKDR